MAKKKVQVQNEMKRNAEIEFFTMPLKKGCGIFPQPLQIKTAGSKTRPAVKNPISGRRTFTLATTRKIYSFDLCSLIDPLLPLVIGYANFSLLYMTTNKGVNDFPSVGEGSS